MIFKKDTVTKPIHNSIQIWYEGEKSVSAGLELDVNIWRLKSVRTKVIMDFGLKIKKSSLVNKVYIYFPFNFEKQSVSDLGKAFQNPGILKGIFNENYVISDNTSNPKNLLVKDDETNKVLFSIYTFTDENDLKIENAYAGTIISFAVKQAAQTETRYYRFRIATRDYSPFVEHHRPKNTFFESAFIETELLDFRINEKRNQDPNLIEKITEHMRFQLDNINFFVMTSINDEVISDGVNLIYKRQLEMGGFWKSYLGIDYKKMSVYKSNNVRKNSSIEDFSCFAKINYRKSNVLTIFKYLFVLLIITILYSVCANMISNMVWHYIEPAEWRILQDESDFTNNPKSEF